MVSSVKYSRPYLYGRKFVLVTDHRPLVYLENMKDTTSKLAKRKISLSE